MSTTLALGLAQAQEGEGPGSGRSKGGAERGGQRFTPPLLKVLDPNGDQVIDADELAGAVAALTALDKDGDGKLSPEEYRGARPGGTGMGSERGKGRDMRGKGPAKGGPEKGGPKGKGMGKGEEDPEAGGVTPTRPALEDEETD
ncbi:MAG: hypothetical protein AAGJ31_11390, partial [Verrucomicrobiota bacterium]